MVILFGNRVFVDIIKLIPGHTEYGVALNPMTGILIRAGENTHLSPEMCEGSGTPQDKSQTTYLGT